MRRDGERIDVLLSSSRVEIDGEPNLVLVMTSVSKEKSLQHQLEHSARVASLGRVAASIAHDRSEFGRSRVMSAIEPGQAAEPCVRSL